MLSGLLVIYSCNFEVFKKGPVEKAPPAGHILEYGTNAPIPNALVYIQECESESLGNISCQQIDTVFSDADGYYQFPVSGFRVNAQKNGFFSDDNSFTYVDVGNETTTDVVLSPYAWLKVTLKNESGAYLINTPGPEHNYYLAKGEIRDFTILGFGNREANFLFSVYQMPNSPIQSLDSISITKSNGDKIIPDYENSVSPRFGIYLPGHDTTVISITY